MFTLLIFYTHDFMLVFLGAPSSEGEFVRGVFGILLGWPLCAGLLQLLSRTVRPQLPLPPIMALSAWALLPLAARNLVEFLSMIVNGEAVTHHGLSGLLIGDHAIIDLASAWMHASVYTLFSFVDLNTFLHIFLLVLTIRVAIAVTTGKAILITTLYGLIMGGTIGRT